MRILGIAVVVVVLSLSACTAKSTETPPAARSSPAATYVSSAPALPTHTATPTPVSSTPNCIKNAGWTARKTASWLMRYAIDDVRAVGATQLKVATPAHLCKGVRVYADYFAVYDPHFRKHKGIYRWAFIAQRSTYYTGWRSATIKAPSSVQQVCRNTLVVLHLGSARLQNDEAPVIYRANSGAVAFYSVTPRGKRAISGDYIAKDGGILISNACVA